MEPNKDRDKMGVNQETDIVEWFEEVTRKAGSTQTETLRAILAQNCKVEYLQKWLSEIEVQEMESSTLELLYTKLVPLSSHKDVEPYIQRIANGDTSPLLTRHPITHLSLSSGTTEGRQKYVPFTQHSAQTTLQIYRLASAFRSRVYPTTEGGRILEFIYSSKQFKTNGGLIAGTATTHYFSSEEFKLKQETTKSYTCSPKEVISCGDYKQSTYCHFLLGLYFSNQVEFIASTFVYGIVHAFRAFEDLWNDLCFDIESGTISSRITIPSIRDCVLQIISPNPGLANLIRAKCQMLEQLNWACLIPTLWPNAKYIYSIMTGSMQPYVKKLRQYAGDLPLVCADYGSTESWVGVNVDPCCPPERVTFAVVPTFSYYEFIPLHRRKSNNEHDSTTTDDYIEDEPVPLSKVKVGQEYEIVITTFTGLYRYRLGDVVEVADFHNSTPKLHFVCRRNLILSINIDKTTESDLQLAVDTAVHLLSSFSPSVELVDFTSRANVVCTPGHYVVYWEIKGETKKAHLQECCNRMDEAFADPGYVVSRKANTIGPLVLSIVERGTFGKIMELYIGSGATLSQFKTPRCTFNPILVKILNFSTIKRYYSTAYG